MSVYVCLSDTHLSPLTYLGNDTSGLHRIFYKAYVLSVAVAQFSDDNAVRYVLPVLWMTPYLPVMGVAKRALILVKATRHTAEPGDEFIMSTIVLF